MKAVIISKQAEEDFEEIYLQTESEFGKPTAVKLFNKFIAFRQFVGSHPFAFGYYYRSKSIRKYILTKSILVLYRVSRDQVEIIALVFTRQNSALIKRRLKKR